MKIYLRYTAICQKALTNDNLFSTFRRNKYYTPVVEHCGDGLGKQYFEEIKKDNPELLKYFDKFITSEQIGNPIVYDYDGYMMSPTTLRYIKVLSDLIIIFGTLNNLDIVEIGSGYGGQCKIIYDIFKPKSYTIIDLLHPSLLAKKYLSHYGINPIVRKLDDESITKYDLCISNYAFSEIDRCFQDFYVDKIIANSKNGYMICNFMDTAKAAGRYDFDGIKNLKVNGKMMDEVPASCTDNIIYVW